jgi:6-pyruvoyltetrahydropterin/6-carboxytetrahydropterin synthase
MPTWTLHTEFTFDSAHFIEGYDGKCAQMHGHTYRVRMSARSHRLHPSKYLPTPDMVCDFRELKWPAADAKKGGLDHGVINDLIPVSTTAERIAEYIHQETRKRIPAEIQLTVTVWETPDSWVDYTDQEL